MRFGTKQKMSFLASFLILSLNSVEGSTAQLHSFRLPFNKCVCSVGPGCVLFQLLAQRARGSRTTTKAYSKWRRGRSKALAGGRHGDSVTQAIISASEEKK
jgi:hypothetical protein